MGNTKNKILNVVVDNVPVHKVLNVIKLAVEKKQRVSITYATFNKINYAYSENRFNRLLRKFDIVHPDGVGVFLASKFLYGNNGFIERMTGSDIYPPLIDTGLNKGWKFFFIGDTEDVLQEINYKVPRLKIVGKNSGYDFDTAKVIKAIDESMPDILVVGVGSPRQEEWIVANRRKINVSVIIAVGDGIKVFAGKKIRGGRFIQMMGLEWMIRLFLHPIKMWRRYILGIPLFIFRILFQKLKMVLDCD